MKTGRRIDCQPEAYYTVNLTASINLKMGNVEAGLQLFPSIRQSADIDLLLGKVFGLFEEASKKKRFVIALDEFQDALFKKWV